MNNKLENLFNSTSIEPKTYQPRKLKYIIVNDSDFELPIIFNEILTHKQIAGVHQVISAGFCTINRDFDNNSKLSVSCHGESVSLKLKSRPIIDSEILEQTLNEFLY